MVQKAHVFTATRMSELMFAMFCFVCNLLGSRGNIYSKVYHRLLMLYIRVFCYFKNDMLKYAETFSNKSRKNDLTIY